MLKPIAQSSLPLVHVRGIKTDESLMVKKFLQIDFECVKPHFQVLDPYINYQVMNWQ